jgi:hypothetical protein
MVIEHYSDPRPDLFAERAFNAIAVDLSQPAVCVVPISAASVWDLLRMATAHEVTHRQITAQANRLRHLSGE